MTTVHRLSLWLVVILFFFLSRPTSAWIIRNVLLVVEKDRRLHRRATTLRRYVASNENNNDNDDMAITNAKDLQREILRRPKNEFSTSTYRNNKRNRLDYQTLTQLQELVKQDDDESSIPTDNATDNEDDDDDDGVFLDGDTYLQSSQRMNPDGSLSESFLEQQPQSQSRQRRRTHFSPDVEADLIQNLAMTPDLAPYSSSLSSTSSTDSTNNNNDSGPEPTMQDLVEAMNRPNTHSNNGSQDELHRQVFENEQAFLEQSKLFQEGLSDETAAKEAQAARRGARYQQEQTQELSKLELALDEWQQVLLKERKDKQQQRQRRPRPRPPQQQQPQPQPNTSTETNSPVVPLQDTTNNTNDDYDKRIKETPQENNGGASPWKLVDDPTTGDQFYWNTETGERKWEV